MRCTWRVVTGLATLLIFPLAGRIEATPITIGLSAQLLVATKSNESQSKHQSNYQSTSVLALRQQNEKDTKERTMAIGAEVITGALSSDG